MTKELNLSTSMSEAEEDYKTAEKEYTETIRSLRQGWKLVNIRGGGTQSRVRFKTPAGIFEEINDMHGNTIKLSRVGNRA